LPSFIHAHKAFYVSTSFKVMYTTLAKDAGLAIPRSNRPLLVNTWRAALGLRSLPHYLIVRDPYRRLESFFRDKFRKHPAHSRASCAADWQPCQRIFFPLLGVAPGSDGPAIRERLLSLAFPDFVRELARVYRRDHHLLPQVDARFVRMRGAALGWIQPTRILRMESAPDLAFLAELLERDLDTPENATDDVAVECGWNAELRAIANRIYRWDFRLYRYPRTDA
jgi:hypothetical protein